ncbi:MAG: DUF6220 domain-containing protein [Chloroflexota bacterium]|nr:DUF6220 domain-containing protein [Chloroflexota bacterium]
MAQRLARAIHLAAAWLLVIGLAWQVFLAGLGVFAGPSNFATHRDTGYLLQVLPFVMLITAALGRLGRRQIITVAVIFALFFVQSILLLFRDGTPAVAALHPVNGFVIVYLAIDTARQAWRQRRAGATAFAAPAPVESELPST